MHQDQLLQVDQMLTVNFRIEISRNEETVTVTADPPRVDTSTGTLRQVIDEKRMVELPLNGAMLPRSPRSLPEQSLLPRTERLSLRHSAISPERVRRPR